MSILATTKLSSKGQIVIPEDVRDKIGLHTGDQFVVVAEKDVVILKVIKKPSTKQFNSLVTQARKIAKKTGLNKQSIKDSIKAARDQ
jgi:AbrB family looped-hinge helix DNA binding protein